MGKTLKSCFLNENEEVLDQICKNEDTYYKGKLLIEEFLDLSSKGAFLEGKPEREAEKIELKEQKLDRRTRLENLIFREKTKENFNPKDAKVIPLPKGNAVVTTDKTQAA